MWWLVTCLLAAALQSCVNGDGTHYKEGEKITVYVNKVGPYFNPQETYHYYSLPVCRPNKVQHASLSLGEVLAGDRKAVSDYSIGFLESFDEKTLCTVELGQEEVDILREAIEDLYYFEFVFDDLPIRGFIGHLEEGPFLPHRHKVSLWTHLLFTFEYNGDQLVSANVSTMGKSPLLLDDTDLPLKVTFTYSAKWFKSSVKYSERNSKQEIFFPTTLEIHWLSIINSVVLVCLLLGFVILILLRVLRNDFSRYNMQDDEVDDQDDYGWKIISTDVFRFPPHKSLLAAVLGNGSQFLTLASAIIFLALLGVFNVHRHSSLNSTAVLLYAVTSGVCGFVSSSMFRKMGGRGWVWNIILSASLFAVPFFLIWSLVNSVAWYHLSTQALPFTTIFLIMLVWLLVGFPLNVLGGILGKNMASGFEAPCRTKNIAREIPPSPWYRSVVVHMAIGGFLPFRSV
jgi:transmembrane 9 superfamily protein 1